MTTQAERRAARVRDKRVRDARQMVGTPLDDGTLASTYLVVAFQMPADLPNGPVALVLKRSEDDPRHYGVVDWELTIEGAERYLAELAERHAAWVKLLDQDEAQR